MTEFVIYSISTNGDVFYIGRTSNFKRRKSEHLHEKKKTYKGNKINKLKTLGLPIEFNILHKTYDFDTCVELEILEIKEHRERGIQLTNLTDGGEGGLGHKPIFTDEWKNKLKSSRKKLFEDGYEVANKGKRLEELIGVEKAKEQKERVGNKISEGIKSGVRKHNKGKTLEEIVGLNKSIELKQEISDRAKNTFTGFKQSGEHIDKRISKQKETKSNWTDEQKEVFSEKYRLNAEKRINRFYFNVDGYEHYGTWKSLSLALKEELGIEVSAGSLSDFYTGKYKSLKCGIKSIIKN